MPRFKHRTPRYRKYKPSGQAVVVLDGNGSCLSKYDPAASHREFDRLIAVGLDAARPETRPISPRSASSCSAARRLPPGRFLRAR